MIEKKFIKLYEKQRKILTNIKEHVKKTFSINLD